MISYVCLFLIMPSWWMPDSCWKALAPTMALCGLRGASRSLESTQIRKRNQPRPRLMATSPSKEVKALRDAASALHGHARVLLDHVARRRDVDGIYTST